MHEGGSSSGNRQRSTAEHEISKSSNAEIWGSHHLGPRMRPRSGDIWGQGTIRGPRKQGARGDGDHGQVARGPTLTTNTVPGPRARGRVIQRRSGEGWIPRQGRGSSSDPSNTVQVRAHADALPKYWRVERKPKSAREGPGNRPKGPAGMETEGWLHEANPTIEHRPTSARARTRNRAKMWGGTETTDREREHNRAFQHRPSPREGGRITEIFGCGGGEGGIRFPRTKGHGTDRRGDGGSEPTDMSHGTGPNNEHHPMSAGARPRNREKMWGGTDTTDREGEPNRAILRRPSPWERGRVAAIFAGERIPKSAHKGPRNRSKGRGWTETTDR